MNNQIAVKKQFVPLKTRITAHFRVLAEQKFFLLMSVPFFIWVIIFRYFPLYGWTMAFQNYKPGKGMFNQKWVGLTQFRLLFKETDFFISLRNTLAMSILSVTIGFVVPVLFALLLNEIKNLRFKKTLQTISYLPHFISWARSQGSIQMDESYDRCRAFRQGGFCTEV